MNFTIENVLERTTDTKALYIGSDAVSKVPQLFLDMVGGDTSIKAIVVADATTYEVAGASVEEALKGAGIATEKAFIFSDANLHAEWKFIEELESYLSRIDATPIAVGSGVINDLTKLVSSHLGKPYMVFGTAVSMDGYSAYGASITYKGLKQTFDCKAPAAIAISPEICAAAPKELAASGYADLMAKVPAGADWLLGNALCNEKIDKFAFSLVQSNLKSSLSSPEKVFEGDAEATRKLADGLIMSGFAMQAMQSSRPASGIEHQFSHFWDMDGLCYKGKHVSHGFKVGIGTLVSTACLEFLLRLPMNELDIETAVNMWPTWDKMEKTIRTLMAKRPVHMERAIEQSREKYVTKEQLYTQLLKFLCKWEDVRKVIEKQILPFDEVKECLKAVHAPYEPAMIGVSKERLIETFRCIPYMRSRISSVDLILRVGAFEECEKFIFSGKQYFK